MHRIAELLRDGLRRIIGRRLVIARPIAVGAPVPLVGAGLRIEYHNTAIAIAVRHIDLLGDRIDRNVGRRAEMIGRIAVRTGDRLADLQHEPAVHGELEDLAVVLVVAGEPDEIVVVDVDAVLALRPIVTGPRPAPVADEIPRGVEHQHGRRRSAALGLRRILLGRALALVERAGPLHHPNMVESVDPDAGHLPEQPVVGQRLRPERIDHELRDTADLGDLCLIDDLGLGERRARDKRL